ANMALFGDDPVLEMGRIVAASLNRLASLPKTKYQSLLLAWLLGVIVNAIAATGLASFIPNTANLAGDPAVFAPRMVRLACAPDLWIKDGVPFVEETTAEPEAGPGRNFSLPATDTNDRPSPPTESWPGVFFVKSYSQTVPEFAHSPLCPYERRDTRPNVAKNNVNLIFIMIKFRITIYNNNQLLLL